jgi:hypothetical protein
VENTADVHVHVLLRSFSGKLNHKIFPGTSVLPDLREDHMFIIIL